MLWRIRSKGSGWVFTPRDFRDFGSRVAIDLALLRHKRAGTIRQLARGLYDVPRRDPQRGKLSPPLDAIVAALKGSDLLGLSDQVPMRVVFLTDGPSRQVRIGRLQILLKRTTPRNMAVAGKLSGLVIQALRHLGKGHVDDTVVAKLRRRLDADEKKPPLKDLHYAPQWIADAMRQIATTEG